MDDGQAIKRAFGENLKAERERADMTQDELAATAGLHRTVPGLIENAHREPKLTTIVKLARGLRIDADRLLRGVG